LDEEMAWLPDAAAFDLEESDHSIHRRTLRALLSMVGREFVLKVLAFLGWIAVARLLDASTFGLFAVSSFAVNLFVVVSEVGLGAAFVRQQTVSARQMNSLFTYQLAWAILIGGVAVAATPLIQSWLGLPQSGLLVQALALALVVISLRTIPCIISQRKLDYGPMVLSDVAAQIAYWSAAFAAAIAGMGAWSAVAAVLAFAVVGTAVLYLRVGWRPSLSFDWKEVHGKARFSLMYQGQQGASLLKYAMLPILGGMVGGADGVGYVTWAHQVAVAPIQLTQLVSRVSFPALARLQHRSEAFANMSSQALKWTCRLTFPACALLVGLGAQLVDYVYGPKWTPALLALSLFAINTAVNAPVGVLMPALYSLNRGERAFRILLAMVVVTWVAGLLLVFAGVGLQAAALGFLAGMLVALAGVLYELRDLGGLSLLRPILLPAATGVVGAVLLQLLAPVVVHGLVTLVMTAAVAGAAMLLLNMWGDYGAVLALLKSLREQVGSRNRWPVVAPENSMVAGRSTTDE
jgi:O-antigen/teichoic acid export membrane protein